MLYPKILIIGQYFHKRSGGGITLSNLFCGWDKNCIASAAMRIIDPDFSICENYYCLGKNEIERKFPFSFMKDKKEFKSGVLKKEHVQLNQSSLAGKNAFNLGKLVKLKDDLLVFSGQLHRRRKIVASNELLDWINEFSPDIIYSQLSSLELIRFVRDLDCRLNKPMVFHMMDDWPISITQSQKGIFRYFWKHTIDKELSLLFSKAKKLLSISESMSEEYKIRYGVEFVPYHNPIDLSDWVLPDKNYEIKKTFTILYAGRIGTGLQNSLLDVASAILNLKTFGLDINFDIQATNDNPVLSELSNYSFVTVKKTVDYSVLPRIFHEVDLLLLPNDFDAKSVSFLKYSMPTKASEYMVSGTPILVYSSPNSAVTKHALKYKWAYVVSENAVEKLESAIRKLYYNIGLRTALGTTAKKFAIEHFNSITVREDFRNVLLNCCINKQL